MRLFVIVLSVLLANSASAALPSLIDCVDDDRGIVLEIAIKRGEIYQVTLKDELGEFYETYDVLLKKEVAGTRFLVEAVQGENVVYAGYDYEQKRGFYGKAANGGRSPLPAIFFTSCALR